MSTRVPALTVLVGEQPQPEFHHACRYGAILSCGPFSSGRFDPAGFCWPASLIVPAFLDAGHFDFGGFYCVQLRATPSQESI